MTEASTRDLAAFHIGVLAKCVVPLFGVGREGVVGLVASATLVQIGNGSTFLFTAGHASDHFGGLSPMIAWPTPGRAPVEIIGDGFTSGPKAWNRAKDVLDIAFLELGIEKAQELKEAGAFVFDANYISTEAPTDSVYAVVGYPLSAVRTYHEYHDRPVTVIEASPRVMFGSNAPVEAYQRVKRDSYTNVVLTRHPPQKGGVVMRDVGKSPRGMSGGAIFCLGTPAQVAAGRPNMRLVGIFTEYRQKQKLLIGVNGRPLGDIFGRASRPSTLNGQMLSQILPGPDGKFQAMNVLLPKIP